MKKLIALFALVAFVGVLTAPAVAATDYNNNVSIEQAFDKDLDKDKDKDKKAKKDKKVKKATKKEVAKKAASEGCGGCGEAAACEGEKTEAKGSCCGEEKKGK